ncbi:MAG: hypothetical protein ABI742_08000 [Gemmatimonadota bacterium]
MVIRMHSGWLLPALVAATLAAANAGTVAAQDTTASTRMASVTYLAGPSIYVSAGRSDGLVEGQELAVIRHDSVAATLRVVFLSSHQSSCEVIRGAADIVVGEQVRYKPSLPSTTTPQIAAVRKAGAPHRLSGPGLHGRVGARYLLSTTEPSSGGFDQPSLDFRLDGSRLGGSPFGLAVDLRTRRTTATRANGPSTVDGHTRVYQAALLWNAPGAGFRMQVGRQYLTAVTSVSLFDGGLMELGGSRLTFGAFGGVEPEPANLGFSKEIQDFGGYLQLHNKSGAHTPWSFTTGAVGSYAGGKSNREFAFAQASVSSQVLSLYALQEVDYYRPWKVSLGERSISPTSTYVNGSIRPSNWLALNGGYDNRRSVRLYRDATDPATAFDDAYRQGVWGGLSLVGHRMRLAGDVRFSDGASAGKATSYTGSFGLDRFTPLHLSLSSRATWYDSRTTPDSLGISVANSGQIYALRLGGDPWHSIHVDLNGGIRRDTNPRNSPPLSTITWYGMDVDISLARAWFLSLSGQREQSPGITTNQFYGSLSWRF